MKRLAMSMHMNMNIYTQTNGLILTSATLMMDGTVKSSQDISSVNVE